MKRGPDEGSSRGKREAASPRKKRKTLNQLEIFQENPSFVSNEEELISACGTGDVEKINIILSLSPFLLDIEDDLGWTPIFHAVSNGKLNAVKALIELGANVNISDNNGCLPLDYASNPVIKRFMLANGADANADRLHDIHKAAMRNDLERIIKILNAEPTKLNVVDPGGWSALYWAAYSQHQHIVKYLLDKGADVELLTHCQFNLINCTELGYGATPLSAYLKNTIGFSIKELDELSQNFRSLIEDQKRLANESNKNILIIFAELHGCYKIYQLQKKLLTVLNNLGINTYLDESHVEDINTYPIVLYAKAKLGMTVIPVDNHPARLAASVGERNIVIAEEISKTNKHAFFITGAQHVYGLLKNENSKIDRNKFHIIPINLTSIICSYQCDMPEIQFLKNRQNAIQIENSAFTSPKAVIEKWNLTIARHFHSPMQIENVTPMFETHRNKRKRKTKMDELKNRKIARKKPKKLSHANFLMRHVYKIL